MFRRGILAACAIGILALTVTTAWATDAAAPPNVPAVAPESPLQALDWAIIGAYFALLLSVAWWVIRQGKDTADDYFLAGRNLGWFLVGASIFASNIGSEHLVGLAGSGCTDGVAMAHYELHAWCLLVLAWVLVPFYARSRVFTMPEFLERRFSPTARWVLSIISLVAYVLTKIAVGIFAGGVVFSALMPEISITIGGHLIDSFWIGSVLVIVLTGLYTMLGGMRAVAYNDAIQTVVLIVGSALLTYYGLEAIGGWGALRESLGSDAFNLWKPMIPEGMTGTWEPVKTDDTIAWYFNGNYPWVGMLFCAPVIGLWYWCTDQYIVQRALGAPNQREARRGSICAAFLKLLPVFIFIIPGMTCLALAKSGLEQYQPLQQILDDQGNPIRVKCQAAFPLMVMHVLPIGVRGIVTAGLLSALMSSLAGVFNASATLFTMDLYQKFRPKAAQAQLVWIGRVATAVLVLIGLAWIPVIRGAQGLYDYLQSVQGYLAPPIFVVFFLGVFFKRLNAKGCLAALILGFALGAFRLAVDTPVKLAMFGTTPEGEAIGYDTGSFLWIVNNIYFQYYSILILIVSAIAMVVVSLMSEKPSLAQVQGITYGTATEEQKRVTREGWSTGDVVASLLVVAVIVAAYLYFNG